MPQYEFACLKCGGLTTYHLPGDQPLNFKLAQCEWCKSKRIRLEQFHADDKVVIDALQGQIEALEARIDALENPDASNEDWEVSN